MRDDRERLLDIREAIKHIDRYAKQGRSRFEADELIQVWMVRHLQIIGEAARALTTALQHRHPECPWSDIIGMRNILVHHYFKINRDIIWDVVENRLPLLKMQVAAILRELKVSGAKKPSRKRKRK
jgi:uncharacterized protein with HEPN domain